MSNDPITATQLGATITGPANERQLAKIEEFVAAANRLAPHKIIEIDYEVDQPDEHGERDVSLFWMADSGGDLCVTISERGLIVATAVMDLDEAV